MLSGSFVIKNVIVDLKLTLGYIIIKKRLETIMYIENINSPSDLKKLSIAQLSTLANEIRDGLMNN